MSQKAKGNLRGLKPSEQKRIEKLFQRRLDAEELCSLDFARELTKLATDLSRRIGVLVSRDGSVEEVCVGSKEILYLPDLGRYRWARGRLRRLKLIFSDLSRHEQAHIPSDIYADLEKLRLDMVCALKAKGARIEASYAYLRAVGNEQGEATHTEQVPDLARLEFDYSGFMRELEDELAASMSEARTLTKDGALLVGVYPHSQINAEDSLAELRELARSAGMRILGEVVQRRNYDPRTLLGKGKLEEVVLLCLRLGAEMLVFDAELKPGQWRAITNSTELKVLDRSMLILDIFAQRAKSSEGRLQVELAQLKYNLPRLVEKDTGLSRLTGGIGGRGPGETKLEIGRRRIRDRIIDLEERIKQLGRQRELRREKQRQNNLPLVAILGYTNVGKSTLFNALTRSDVFVENKLFATLDPAQRRLLVPLKSPRDYTTSMPVVLSDTVGFIRDLPDELRTAFKATLEELHQADLLLEVLDVSDRDVALRKRAVDQILDELGLNDLPRMFVLNKTDLVSAEVVREWQAEFGAFAVSALTREGLNELLWDMGKRLREIRPDFRDFESFSGGAPLT